MDSPPESVPASLLLSPSPAAMLGARMDPCRSPAPLPSLTGASSGEGTRAFGSSAQVCQWMFPSLNQE